MMTEEAKNPFEGYEWLVDDIDSMIEEVGTAARFRMCLHLRKGGWHNASFEALFQGLLKNLHEFYAAYRRGDERELCNEGLDCINRFNMILDNFAYGEVSALQDHDELLARLLVDQVEEDCAT